MKKFILRNDLREVFYNNRRFINTFLFIIITIYYCSLNHNSYAASFKTTKAAKVTKAVKATNTKKVNNIVPSEKSSNFDDIDDDIPVKDSMTASEKKEVIDKFTGSKDSIVDAILNDHKRVDIGQNFLNEIALENNRLYYYDLYIKLAQAKGYVVTSFIDYLNNYKNTDAKVLILRHDIDVADSATRSMFEIEKRNNVKATYYFRWKTFDKELIKELHNSGFEVGLHYETIATYCVENKKYLLNDADFDKCRELLKQEITDFKEKTGINIQTIASHGNPINKQIGISNNILLKGQKYEDFGIVCETYDEDILQNYVKAYICDGDILKNFGYSYQSNPIDSIIKDDKVIEFLSHPNHWNYTDKQREDILIKAPTDSNGTILK